MDCYQQIQVSNSAFRCGQHQFFNSKSFSGINRTEEPYSFIDCVKDAENCVKYKRRLNGK